jgi:hypothetical protein
MYGARLFKTIIYNDSREWRPICRSRCLNLTASGRASRCGSAPTAISSSPWKTTGGACERIFVRASKSGSSKVGAIAVWNRKLRKANRHNRRLCFDRGGYRTLTPDALAIIGTAMWLSAIFASAAMNHSGPVALSNRWTRIPPIVVDGLGNSLLPVAGELLFRP